MASRWVLGLGVLLSGAGCAGMGGESGEVKDTPLPGRSILPAAQVEWEGMDDGWRRQVIFSGELTFVLLEARKTGREEIPLHHHVHDQISYVLDGEIEVQVGEETQRMGPGGYFRVPSDVPHGIRLISPTARLIDAFSPPREEFRPDAG